MRSISRVILVMLLTVLLAGCSAQSTSAVPNSTQAANFPLTIVFQDKELSGTYNGDIINGKPSGEGEFLYQNEEDNLKYVGSFSEGQFIGNGTLDTTLLTINFPEVSRVGTYKGSTIDGLPSGQGEFSAVNAEGTKYTYTGEWANGTFNGQGLRKFEGGYNYQGTYKDGVWTPSFLDRLISFGTRESDKYTVSDKAKVFLSEHSELFPSKNVDDLISFLDSNIRYAQLIKNSSSYGDNLVKLSSFKAYQVFETEQDDGSIMTYINMSKGDATCTVYYPDKCGVLQGDTLTVYGLPLAYSSYENVAGGETLTCIIAASYIK